MEINQIFIAFKQLGYQQTTLISQSKIIELLHQLYRNNYTPETNLVDKYDDDISNQLWEECSTNSKNQVILIDFVKVVHRAQQTLIKKIKYAQQRIQQASRQRDLYLEQFNQMKQSKILTRKSGYSNEYQISNINEKINKKSYQIREHTSEVNDFTYNLKMVTIPFYSKSNPPIDYIKLIKQTKQIKQIIPQKQKKSIVEQDTRQKQLTNLPNKFEQIQQQQYQYADKQYNTQLKILFYLVIIFSILELFIQFNKSSFLNILSVCLLTNIFLFGYFDYIYNRFALLVILISFIFDIIWIIVKIKDWWNPSANSTISNLNGGFLRMIIIFMFLVLVIKLIVIYILFGFRKVNIGTIYYIKIRETEIQINSNNNNPIRSLITKSINFNKNVQ